MALNHRAYKGKAHALLTKIQNGTVEHFKCGGVDPVGYGFDDGSELTFTPGEGWMLTACVPGCVCLVFAFAEARAR